MAAVAVAGMTLAFPVSFGIAMVIGGGLTFLLNPAGQPSFLLLGATRYIVGQHADYSLVGPSSMSVPGYPFTPARPGRG